VSDIVQRYLDSKKRNCPCPFPVVTLKGQYCVPRYLLSFHDLDNLVNQILVLRAENERLRTALRDAYEVYAGSDGFIPETAAEGYLQHIIKQMVDCINTGLEKKL